MSEKKDETFEVAGPDLRSPREWALVTGNGPVQGRSTLKSSGTSILRGSVAHEVAKVLHGWDSHKHHTGTELLLSKEDYLLALEAAMPAKGNPKPYTPALSPHKGGGVKVTFKG